MFNYRKAQKGQAIILLALAVLGLFAMTALAIDSGNSFSDRRHAQLAADNAALAGALAKANPPENVTHDAYLVTDRNGYKSDADHQVTVIDGGPFKDCKDRTIDPVNHADPDDRAANYVEVMIHSSVPTLFGQVIGVYKMYNCVYSIAREEPSKQSVLLQGQALAAVDCEGKNAVDTTGSSKVYLIGGGMFSNSSHEQALLINSPRNLETLSVEAVGGIKANDWDKTPLLQYQTQDAIPCPFPDYMVPKYVCDFTYNTDFPPIDGDEHVTVTFDALNNKIYNVEPGVYCLNAKFNNPNMIAEDVSFVVLHQGIYWQANASGLSLKATDDPTNPMYHILIYMPMSNEVNTIVINGAYQLNMEGSVLAPGANISLNGDFVDSSIKAQWIGGTIHLAGNLNATIVYEDSLSHVFVQPPLISLCR